MAGTRRALVTGMTHDGITTIDTNTLANVTGAAGAEAPMKLYPRPFLTEEQLRDQKPILLPSPTVPPRPEPDNKG